MARVRSGSKEALRKARDAVRGALLLIAIAEDLHGRARRLQPGRDALAQAKAALARLQDAPGRDTTETTAKAEG